MSDGLVAVRQGGTKVAPFLQYEVREGREASEAGVRPSKRKANRKKLVLMQLELFNGQ